MGKKSHLVVVWPDHIHSGLSDFVIRGNCRKVTEPKTENNISSQETLSPRDIRMQLA